MNMGGEVRQGGSSCDHSVTELPPEHMGGRPATLA